MQWQTDFDVTYCIAWFINAVSEFLSNPLCYSPYMKVRLAARYARFLLLPSSLSHQFLTTYSAHKPFSPLNKHITSPLSSSALLVFLGRAFCFTLGSSASLAGVISWSNTPWSWDNPACGHVWHCWQLAVLLLISSGPDPQHLPFFSYFSDDRL